MPYGLPKEIDTPDMNKRMESCVVDVMAKGKNKVSAIKICKARLQKAHMAISQEKEKTFSNTIISMAIFPAKPTKTLGMEIKQEMIDGLLAYNPSFRRAYLYLNEIDAHNNAGPLNKALLAKVDKVYEKDDRVWADVIPQKLFLNPVDQKHFEEELKLALSENGGFPERSIDMTPNVPGWEHKWLFEGIAAVGAARAAVVDLPTVKLSKMLDNFRTQSFTVNLNNQENKQMGNEGQVSFTKDDVQKMINDAVASTKTEMETSFAKEREAQKQKDAANALTLSKKESRIWLESDTIKKKIPSTLRESLGSIRLALAQLKDVKVTFSKQVTKTVDGKKVESTSNEELPLEDAFVELVESLPNYVETKKRLEDIPSFKASVVKGGKEEFSADELSEVEPESYEDQEKLKMNAIKVWAEENKLSLEKDYDKCFTGTARDPRFKALFLSRKIVSE